MEVRKADLQEALEIVKPGLASKEIIQQTTSFAFKDGRAITYNDEISISCPVPGMELEGAIQAEDLYKILSKISLASEDDKLQMELEDNQVTLKVKRMRMGFTLQQEILLPLDASKVTEMGEWNPLPKDFCKFISIAAPSCSRDMSNTKATCIHINREGFLEACDNRRITRCSMETEMPVDSFLLPASSAVEVVKLDPTDISYGNGWVHFRNDNEVIISCRILEEGYPDTSALLNVDGKEITFPDGVAEALDRASVFSKRQHMLDEAVVLTLANKRLKIEAESETGSWIEEELPFASFTGNPVVFAITPYLLRDILKETKTFVLGSNKLKFEGEGWTYVSSLRYLKDKEK